MEAADLAGDGRTFKADFTSGGVAELRARVREKLGEFMGDAEDTLVEYVIVLLRNGRRQDEASKELHVFLGDDSAEFISWLWDHLSLNLHLYVQSQECDQEIKNNEVPKEVSGRQKPSEAHLRSNVQTDPEHTSESSKASRGRNKREWKGIVREGNETFPLRNVITGILHGEEKKVQKSNEIRHLPLSNQRNGRKRDWEDEQQQPKRDLSSYPMVGASRRLLQSAVRDAVKTVQQTSSSTEPSSKRLRSVVSTTSAETMHDKRSQRTRRVLQVSGAALALKAAAEAAADSTKVRYSGSVFSRLGPGNTANQPSGFCDELRDHEEFEAVKTIDDHDDEIPEDLTIVDKETEMNVDSASDNDVDRDDGSSRYQSSDSHASTFLSIVDNKASLVKFNVAPETDMVQISRLTDEEPSTIRASRLSDEEQSASCLPTTSKIVSMPANANTLELSNYETPKDVHVVEKTDITTMKPNISIPSQGTPVAEIMKDLGPADVQKDSQRSSTTVASSYSTAHPTEDADSRTLYVSNVHFAATKDSLSRHFNKFGAVLKVVIVTNAATGQPTGSAYVEFLHKESAERALSLNGTSFMTRILKVVRRSSHEAAHFYGWPGSGRSSLYARHGRMAYNPRGVLPGSSFRGGRVPMKAGARSLQWKREPSGADLTAGTKPDMSVSLSSAEQVLPPPT